MMFGFYSLDTKCQLFADQNTLKNVSTLQFQWKMGLCVLFTVDKNHTKVHKELIQEKKTNLKTNVLFLLSKSFVPVMQILIRTRFQPAYKHSQAELGFLTP